jgi:hypothetical protein
MPGSRHGLADHPDPHRAPLREWVNQAKDAA